MSESPITTKNQVSIESCNQPEFIVDLWDNEHIQEEMEEGALSQQTHEAEPGSNQAKFQVAMLLTQMEFQVAMLLTQMVLLIQS